MSAADLARVALRIRAFELGVLELFGEGRLAGTVHTCVGQELLAAALAPSLDVRRDGFVASHRGHGHFLALGGDGAAMLAELAGRAGALCGGRAGSQHLQHERFFATGVQGGTAALATGLAYGIRMRGERGVAVAQLGDGTLGEGAVYEALTLAAVLHAPVLFLVEWNGIAMTTPTARTTPGDLLQRFAGFGVEAARTDDRDPAALREQLGRAVARVREGAPFVQIVDTRRLAPHSKGDDTRTPAELAALHDTDPLAALLARDGALREHFALERAAFAAMAAEVLARPEVRPDHDGALAAHAPRARVELHYDREGVTRAERFIEALRDALGATLEADPSALLLGQDLADPYGGAFKATRGLSTAHPARVLSTPISEAGTAGVAVGMAMAGLRPIVESMFSDFATLSADALINLAAKVHYTSQGRAACPLVLRLPAGGGRGYGPTHSQCMERLYCGVPGLRVVALSSRHDPGALWSLLRAERSPVVLVEPKAVYPTQPPTAPPPDLHAIAADAADGDLAPLCYAPADAGRADVAVVTYGASTAVAEAAMRELLVEDELRFEYVVLTQLWPLEVRSVERAAARAGRVVVVEEEAAGYGVGAALVASLAASQPGLAVRAVGARPVPIPAAPVLERAVLPATSDVVRAIRDVVRAPRRSRDGD